MSNEKTPTALGEILVTMGFCSMEEMYEVFLEVHCDVVCEHFGKILLDRKIVSQNQLNAALAVQKKLVSDDPVAKACGMAAVARERKSTTSQAIRRLTATADRITATKSVAPIALAAKSED